MNFWFFNSISRKKQEFQPRDRSKKRVNLYSCGPTVYDVAHIGNFRSYIFTDILARSLKLAGYEVKSAMNITDVDDKTIQATLKKNSQPNLSDLNRCTEPFIQAFFEDIRKMNIEPANHYPRATENIPPMLKLVECLIQKDFAYEKDGSLYFSIEKKKNYGKLSKLDLSEMKTGLRYNTDEYSKDDVRDFVLWKKETAAEHLVWDSPVGRGRPGWHLECSAMVHDLFAGQLDIHTGGVDLIFPHHENEIAQSESAFGGELARYWLHCEHLLINGKKMSKSQGNFYTLRDLFKQGYHPMAIRYLLISVPYRQKINFTLEALEQAARTLRGIWGTYSRFIKTNVSENLHTRRNLSEKVADQCERLGNEFLDHLKDDLNTAKALSTFHNFLGQVNIWLNEMGAEISPQVKDCLQSSFDHYDSVLGILSHHEALSETEDVPEEVRQMLVRRDQARREKDFERADQLRKKILDAGYEILDSKEGSQLRPQRIRVDGIS